MNDTVKYFLVSFFCCALLSSSLWGQGATSQVVGIVRDPSGLAVPGAEVKATQTATGLVRTVTTAQDGTYTLQNLPIGPYTIEIAKEGFTKYIQTGIVLQVDSNPTLDATLKVGSTTEQVVVQENADLVEAQSSGVGQVVDSQRVVEMPLNGRNPTELIFLAGMATTATGVGSINSVRNYPTVLISVAGGLPGGVAYLLDGANHNDGHNNLNLPLPFPDALQEFKVETSALTAQYGNHAAGTVNAVTKSGTNAFHGDMFEFLRNGDLNARDFFATSRDTLKRNQFGGTVGGPIRKDKLFFFAAYQGTIQKSAPSQSIGYVPTAAMVGGDFTAIASPACNAGKQITLPTALGFTNNTISASMLNPVALNLEKLLPTTANPCGKVTYGIRTNQSENLGVTKIDYQLSDKQSLFGRLTVSDLVVPSAYSGTDPLAIVSAAAHYRVYALAGGDTYVINPNTVNAFHLSATRVEAPKVGDTFTTWQALGSNVTPLAPGQLYVDVTGNGFAFGGVGNGATNGNFEGPNPNVSDDLSLIKGSHQLGFGVDYLHSTEGFTTWFRAPGSFTFNGQVTGIPLADLMLGDASAFSQGNIAGWNLRNHYFGVYAQDSWKATSRLTVNYGIRFEPYFAPSSKFDQFANFNPGLFDENVRSTIYTKAPAGLIFPGDPQYTVGNAPEGSRLNRFAPRLGLAWDPLGSGRMTVRASWGVFTDRQYLQSYTSYGTNPPYGNTVSLANVNLSNPWANYAGGNPFPFQTGPNQVFPTFGQYTTSTFNYKPPYMNQWNLSVQRQIGNNWLFTANYVGNNTIHLVSGDQLNPAVFLGLGPCTIQGPSGPVNYSVCSTTTNTNQRRVLYLQNPSQGQYYAAINALDDGGTANYNGLYLSAQRRLTRGISALANYTWSHCISDTFEPQIGVNAVTNIPGDRAAYRSNCAVQDVRQIFNLSMVAQMPKFSGRVLRLIASDWQVSPLITLKSAQLFSVTTGVDNALTGQPTETPNLCGNPYPANQSVNNWLNPAAFCAPAPGTYGNLGLNNLKGPGVFQFDLALTRAFAIREKQSLLLRAEFFNLPNHLNPSVPGTSSGGVITTSTNSGSFSQIQSDISGTNGLTAGDPRIIQLALKYVF
jgi:Carboxypeptidase regulatory-like domain